MQQSVIFGILLTLLNKRKVKRSYLAEKYEISTRTVQRYIDVLNEAGVPIVSVSGANGGFWVADNFRLETSYFSEEEISRIVSCISAMRANFNDNVCRDILDKMQNTARNKSNDQYLVKSDSLIIDIGTWNNPSQYRGKMEVINKAIEGSFSLEMNYIDSKERETHRMFDPYSLVLKEGVWYVYGFCHLRQDFRLFRLTRIASLHITKKTFEKKPSDVFERIKRHIDDGMEVDVEFEFYSTALAEIEEWLGPEAVIERGVQYVAKATLYGGNALISKLLSFGSSVKVLRPAALREEIAVECKRILESYGYENR